MIAWGRDGARACTFLCVAFFGRGLPRPVQRASGKRIYTRCKVTKMSFHGDVAAVIEIRIGRSDIRDGNDDAATINRPRKPAAE